MRLVRRIAVAALALPLSLIGLLALLWGVAMLRETDGRVPARTTLVETRLGRIAATVTGPADGRPILLVHGSAAWSGFWRDIAAHLAAKGWRVVAADLPPFGYSDHDPEARYDRASQAERLAALLRAVSNKPAAVVGHSFGAGAATELALRSPGQIRGLVLVDAALGTFDPQAPSSPGLLGSGMVAQPLTSLSITNPWAIGPLMRSFISRKEAAAPWLETLRQPMRRPGSTAAYAAWLPSLFSTNDGGLSWKSSEVAKIRIPVDLIWGETDTVTPIAQGEHIAKLVRARSFAKLKGVGHIPHIEAPAEFLAALDAALAQP
jgi:pimeloyl-ACP methyl ester carboxylesterase